MVLISIESAIDAFEDFIGKHDDADPSNLKSVTMTGIRQILKALPPAEPELQWIPVSERLPVESGFYLVTDTYGEVVLASWFKYDFDDEEPQWRLTEYGSIEVVAWMPLPQPWKGEKE